MEAGSQSAYYPAELDDDIELTPSLPDGVYFFLKRLDGSRLPNIIGFLYNEEYVLYISLIDGQALFWKDAINFEILRRKVYSLPIRISSSSIIVDTPCEDLNLHIGY